MNFDTDFGTIILDDNNIIDNPFMGGFNKPKIQWIDWDFDGDDDLFLLDEDASIKYYKNHGCINDECSFELITTSFQGINNISWFYIADFNQDNNFEIITQDSENLSYMMYYESSLINGNIILEQVDIVLDVEGNIVESNPVMVPTFIDIDGDNVLKGNDDIRYLSEIIKKKRLKELTEKKNNIEKQIKNTIKDDSFYIISSEIGLKQKKMTYEKFLKLKDSLSINEWESVHITLKKNSIERLQKSLNSK